jgi:hypothetical protein
MVNVKDIQKLLENYMLEPEIPFKDLKPYLLSEFDWKVNPIKKSQFMIRGLPILDDRLVSDILKSFLPNETIILKLIE